MIKKELKGLIVPMITPFNEKGEIDEDGLRQITEWLIHSGVNGLFPNSSTGEAAKMTLDERKKVMKIVVDEANGKVPVFPGTGDPSTKNTLELTKYAEDIGADGVVVVAPYYFKPDESSLIEHYKSICSATRIPIMLYNIPQSTGYSLSINVIVKLAKIKNIFAMKDSSSNMIYFHKIILSTRGELLLFQGSEFLLLPSLVIGASGGVLGMGNICPKLILS
ncbi:MAG TPA: dihydrodipicolinate synthase family protein, partial [Thermoprotei archaeon]|nr:dihydrodipicolinate synthase family protein [Thermoprotei archaeon]